MAKSAPTIVVGTTPQDKVLAIQYTDIRGQKVTKRYSLGGAVTNTTIAAIVAHLDMISNAQITSAELETVTTISGMNSAAQNALERNLSETMALTFQVTDPINAAKVIARTLVVPAMIAGIELLDGTPDVTNTDLAALVGTSGNNYNDGVLSASLFYKDGGGTAHTGMLWIPGESHHISLADVVDNV